MSYPAAWSQPHQDWRKPTANLLQESCNQKFAEFWNSALGAMQDSGMER